MSNKYAIIIPCRTGSTRFPCKILLPFNTTLSKYNAPDLIANKIGHLDHKVIYACSESDRFKLTENSFTLKWPKLEYGSEADVIGRVLNIALNNGVENIIDITSDCPLIGADLIKLCIKQYEKSGSDYFSNVLPVRKDPDGFDVQIYKTSLLQRAYDHSNCIHEHVGWNIPNLFKDEISICNEGHGIAVDKCLTLDEPSDYFEIQRCIDEIGINASHLDIVSWLDRQDKMGNESVKRKSV